MCGMTLNLVVVDPEGTETRCCKLTYFWKRFSFEGRSERHIFIAAIHKEPYKIIWRYKLSEINLHFAIIAIIICCAPPPWSLLFWSLCRSNRMIGNLCQFLRVWEFAWTSPFITWLFGMSPSAIHTLTALSLLGSFHFTINLN